MQNDSMLLEQQYKLQIKYFEDIEKCRDNIRAIKHDIGNHLFCIQHFLENGHLEEARNYLNNIDEKIVSNDMFSNSGNLVIDALLNSKYELFVQEGIEIEKTIIVPQKLKIDNLDLCVVLSNVIDNAIEACKKIKSGKKSIWLSVDYKKELLFINIINTYEQEIKQINNRFITTKKDKENHGIGLQNVKSTVAKYNGYIKFDIKDGLFEADIFMCDISI
jgi:sensor histidine kinase regulating citrate/malate metabolism